MSTLLMALALALTESGYELVGEKNGVQVYVRQDSSQAELAAVGVIDLPPAEVQAALLDYRDAPMINKRLAESTVISDRDGVMVVYQRLKLPVISDRDYTLRVSWTPGEARGIEFAIATSAGPVPSKKLVRMKTLSGRWDLEPIRGGRATKATYHVAIDLGGSVSRSSVRNGSAKEMPEVFSGIFRLANARRTGAALTTR